MSIPGENPLLYFTLLRETVRTVWDSVQAEIKTTEFEESSLPL
jgi:hypothetical protein